VTRYPSRVPTAKRIAAICNVSRETAIKVRRILDGRDEPETVDACDRWVRQCYHRPPWHERAMFACDVLLDTAGVECIERRDGGNGLPAPALDYCNTGDPWVGTLLYYHESGNFGLGSWGDWLETAERRNGRVYR
jgi:hypothetical protein